MLTMLLFPELEKQQVVLIPTPAAEMLEPTLTIPAPSPTEGVTESDLAQHFLAPVMSNVGFTSDSPVQQSTPLIFTERLDYALSPNQEHGVRTGKRAQFTRCDEEPIHIPGAIQSHGMLVGLDMAGDGGSGIRYVCRVS
jgi:hypothetical protein